MKLYRIAQAPYINDLSGLGAYLYGGRWSLPGTYALYTASSRSLAYLEYLVHQFERDTWPVNLKIAEIQLKSTDSIYVLKIEDVTSPWGDLHYHVEQQSTCTRLFEKGYLGISTPSVIVPEEDNYILNPKHPDFGEIVSILSIADLRLDKRFSGEGN